MKKRGILLIVITLLLTFSTIAVLSASNPNFSPIFLNPSPNNIGAVTKSYAGSGNQLNAILYITNNYNDTLNATNTDSNVYVPCPSGWEILWANLTLFNITAPNATLASNYTTPNTILDLVNSTAMSFQLTNNAYLDYIIAQLDATTPTTTANFFVYTASNNGGKPIPQNQIAFKAIDSIPNGVNWVNVSFGHQFLNISTTWNKTFFIAIKQTSVPGNLRWDAVQESSPPGNGYVYYFNSTSTSWVEKQDHDCQLVVGVSASNNTPADSAFPSEIGLTINGSPVQDINKGNGTWTNNITSSVSTGYIIYDANSTWMSTVSFNYTWNITMSRNTSVSALTNFDVSLNTAASWNITVNANNSDGFPPTNGVNHINITGTPSDWNFTNSMVYNASGDQWNNLSSRPPDNISFLASNGTWIVNCTAPNYVSGIGFDVGGVPVENATLYDNLNINVTFDTTLMSNVSGTTTLNIYDFSIPQILNHTEGKLVNQVTKTSFTWDVDTNTTSIGLYNVTISFKDEFAVGYKETPLNIVALTNTSLTVTSYPTTPIEYPGLVPITLCYNGTNGQRLSNASINAYFANSTPAPIQGPIIDHGNGFYDLNLNFSSTFGVHDVYFNASGLRLFNPNSSTTISINYTKVLVSIHLNTPQIVQLNTTLPVSADLWYTTTGFPVVGQNVNFNFSIRFSNGTNTTIQRTTSTNGEGRATPLFTVPPDAVELNVTAFYIGTDTVFGATSSTKSVTLTSGPVNPLGTGLVALMFLMLTQQGQGQNSMLYPILGVVIGAAVVVTVTADRARRRHAVPLKALASLENIIVDHVPSGVTMWAFDFLKMEQDVTLVSGFMSAVKSFLGEMKKGGLRKMDTEFGTFIREDGEFLTATCITSGSTQEEEKWIREKLHSFVATAERQNWDTLADWKGEVSHLRPRFLEVLSSLIDLEKAEQLQREKVLKVLRKRERLQVELNNLGTKLETLNQQLSDGKISRGEFEARKAEIEPKYDRVQMDYIRASILVSKVPYTLEATWEKTEAKEEMGKIRDKFVEITMEIDALQRKAQVGRITTKELKRKENLQKELMALIEKLDKGKAE